MREVDPLARPRRRTVIEVADQQIVDFARTMRGEPTSTEEMVWSQVRGGRLGAKFRRQHPVDRFILDFYCAEARLAVEIDGSSHEGREAADRYRDATLADLGIVVLRVTDQEVRSDLAGTMRRIREALER